MVSNMVKSSIAHDKSLHFAIRIVRLYQFLQGKNEYVLSKQILRSGTSIGANLAEAKAAITRKDFQSKVYIALKECSETLYWLELLKETDYISNEQYQSLYNDCEELRRILSSTTRTLSSKETQQSE